jgi:hypothetical protein
MQGVLTRPTIKSGATHKVLRFLVYQECVEQRSGQPA